MATRREQPFPQVLPAWDVGFVGRSEERALLVRALAEAREGRGSTWLVEGPAGMGKTSLVRWAQEQAEGSGFQTLWGYGLREVNTPFFPWVQIFRTLQATPKGSEAPLPFPLPSLVVMEGERPLRLFQEIAKRSREARVLVIGRERPELLRRNFPDLDPSARALWLSKGEGADRIPPADLDRLGELAGEHLRKRAGSFVALSGLDYLATQNEFRGVLRLVQFLRETAEDHDGHVLLSVNPRTFQEREVAILEGEGAVVRAPSAAPEPSPSAQSEPASSVMLRYLDLLEEGSSRRPLFLVVDDVQWADPVSIRTFQFLARNLRKLRVILMSTNRTDADRPPEEEGESPLGEVLDAMDREGSLHRMPLEGMVGSDANELALALLGAPLVKGSENQDLLELLRRGGGNPFFLKETLRQLASEGRVHQSGGQLSLDFAVGPEGSDDRGTLPDSLRRLVARRLEPLTPEERDVLEWATLAGSVFDLAPLSDALAFEPSAVLDALTHRAHLLEEAGRDRWAFAHPLVWEVALAEMSESERVRRAKRLGDWWAEHRSEEPETVARLYHDAHDPGAGLPWVRRMIEETIRSGSLDLIERYHRWLQDLLQADGRGIGDRVGEGLEVINRLFDNRGPTREAAGVARALLQLGPPERERWEIEADLAYCLATTTPTETRSLLEKRDAASGQVPEPRPLGRAIVALARTRLATVEGRDADFERYSGEVLSLGDTVPRWTRIDALFYSGAALVRLGDRAGAEKRLTELQRLAEPSGNPRLMATFWNLQMFLTDMNGDVAQARKASEATLALRRTGGNSLSIVSSMFNLGEAFLDEGNLPRAREVLAEFQRYCEKFNDERGGSWGPCLAGEIALRAHEPKEAEALLRRAVDDLNSRGDRESVLSMRIRLAEAHLCSGSLPEAQRELHDVGLARDRLEATRRAELPMIEGWCLVLVADFPSARKKFEEGVRLGREAGHVFLHALATNYLARWEEAFGDADRARALWSESQRLLDRSGVLPGAWSRTWPPPFSPAPAHT